MENLTTTANTTLTQTLGTLNGRAYELATYKGGRVELYEEYADQPGLRAFVGYADEVLPHLPATFARDLAPLFRAHHQAHADFWATYLPGAERWIH